MALMDEFKEERELVKKGTLKQKISYFWDYYKWYVLLTLIIISFASNYIYNLVTTPETILNGILLNSCTEGTKDTSTDLVSNFSAEQDIDTNEYDIYLDTSLYYTVAAPSTVIASNYQSMQTILARSTIGNLDFIASDMDAMIDLAYKNLFTDLTEILSTEQLALYEPYLCYIDLAIVKELDEANSKNEDTTHITLPNWTMPETMTEPIPVLIDVSKSKDLNDVYSNSYDTLALGVVNDTNIKTTLLFIDYLMK